MNYNFWGRLRVPIIVFTLIFSSHSTFAYISERQISGSYEELLMSNAGVAYLGSAGNGLINPAGLAYLKDPQRYYGVLAVGRFRNRDVVVDNGVSFIPAFVAKTFSFKGGILEGYLSSSQFNINSRTKSGTVETNNFGNLRETSIGLAWGRKWGEWALGISSYLSNETTSFSYNEEDSNPAARSVVILNRNQEILSLRYFIGLAGKFSWGNWGMKLAPPASLIKATTRDEGTYFDLTGNTQTSIDAKNNDRVGRASYAKTGLQIDLSNTTHLLFDLGYVFPVKEEDQQGKHDYSGAYDVHVGTKLELENDRNIFAGTTLESQNTDSISKSHDNVDYKVSFGFGHKLRTSNTFYGMTYRQDEKGDSQAYALIFGSDFSL